MAASKTWHALLRFGTTDIVGNQPLEIHTDWLIAKETHGTSVDLHHEDDLLSAHKQGNVSKEAADFMANALMFIEGIKSVTYSKTQITLYKFRPTRWDKIIDVVVAQINKDLCQNIIWDYNQSKAE
jgi:hypothetical protein